MLGFKLIMLVKGVSDCILWIESPIYISRGYTSNNGDSLVYWDWDFKIWDWDFKILISLNRNLISPSVSDIMIQSRLFHWL